MRAAVLVLGLVTSGRWARHRRPDRGGLISEDEPVPVAVTLVPAGRSALIRRAAG